MGGPEADGWEGEVDVLAWLEGPGAGDADGHAHAVAWEGFHCCAGWAAEG